VGEIVTVAGWSRTVRKHGAKFCFVALSDGSTSSTIQVLVHNTMPEHEKVMKCGVGCSFKFTGVVEASPATGQAVELSVQDPSSHRVVIFGVTDQASYPLAKKQHSKEFLREIAHLRSRTFLVGCISRMRSQMSMAVHRFFQDKGFQYVHTPIITASDCEGAGEMFQVSTILTEKHKDVPVLPDGKIDYKKDFFGKPAFLTVSGQLNVETYCCGLSDVYTFGPTFRAENSHTSRHLAEFWMIEPEIAFADLHDCMELTEAFIKYLVDWGLQNCRQDLLWFDKNIENGLIDRLEAILKEPFHTMTYTEAINELEKHSDEFEINKIEWGMDLASEHERYLTEKLFKKPVIVYNYPRTLKAFYMRANDDDKTVSAMDCLLPKIGEIVGGSQREERLDVLDKMIKEKGLETEPYWWYRELRSFGTVPHSGFGLGFERLIMMMTGVENIRDVIPFPRYPHHADF